MSRIQGRSRSSAAARRKFIIDTLRKKPFVTDAEIEEAGKTNSPPWKALPQSLKDDAEHFKQIGLAIIRPKNEARFINLDLDRPSTFERRLREDIKEKDAIGLAAAAIVLGPRLSRSSNELLKETTDVLLNSPDQDSYGDKEGYLLMPDQVLYDSKRYKAQNSIFDVQKLILAWLDNDGTELRRDCKMTLPRKREIVSKLFSYFRKSSRHIACDAGSTNLAFARALLSLARLPETAWHLSKLNIWTNCIDIANVFVPRKFDPPPPDIEVMLATLAHIDITLIGGQLRKDTIALSGELTKQALEKWNPDFDVAIIGTTSLSGVDTGTGELELVGFQCDTVEEAQTKSELLHRSNLRIVLMDTSKCLKERSSAFTFAPVSPNYVDFIITDWRISNRDACEKSSIGKMAKMYDLDPMEDFKQCYRALWKAGIPVLQARPVNKTIEAIT